MSGNRLLIKDFQPGMVVITPNSIHPVLTKHKNYIVLDVIDDHIKIMDDTGAKRYYQAYLFIEPGVYYTIALYMTISRLFSPD
jgi:hypothetical protein